MTIKQIQQNEGKQYCDVRKEWKNIYIIITIVYTSLIMLVPIIIIIISNYLIIFKTRKADINREQLQHVNSRQQLHIINTTRYHKKETEDPELKENNNYRLKPYYVAVNNQRNTINRKDGNSKKIAQTLFLVSFSYAFLNLPYLIAWYIYIKDNFILYFYYYTLYSFFRYLFYYQVEISKVGETNKNYFFSIVQLTEILYVLNYGLKFYIFCVSGTIFRNQLKNSTSKLKN